MIWALIRGAALGWFLAGPRRDEELERWLEFLRRMRAMSRAARAAGISLEDLSLALSFVSSSLERLSHASGPASDGDRADTTFPDTANG